MEIKYKTQQTDIILNALKEIGKKVRIVDLVEHLGDKQDIVSKATIYRKIKILEDLGKVRTYNINGIRYYEYVNEENNECLNLVCSNCAKTIKVDCDFITQFNDHIKQKHKFEVNLSRTVVYGLCDECS